jgi:Protein of unknown function, DUF481
MLNLKLTATVLAVVAIAATSARSQEKPAPKPAPDVIVFTNGDQLSGTLERGVGNTIVFKSDMAGEITVSLDKVKELRSSGSFALLRKDVPITRTPVVPGKVVVADGNVTVANSTGTTQTVAVKDMSYLIDQTTYNRELNQHRGAFTGWNGTINGGATLVRSTTDANTYTVGIALVRAIPTVPYLPARNRTTFDLQETYGKQTSPANPQTTPPSNVVVETSIFHADAERDEYFSARFYALGQTSFDHNFAQGLSLQSVFGGGIGWTPIKDAKQQLDVKADIHYEQQQFQAESGTPTAPSQNLIGSTFAEAYHRTLPHKLLFTESANVLPAWNDSNAYAANATASIALPVYKRLAMQFSTTDNFLNDPAPTFKKNSYQFVTGVTYTLH